jgi:hypothetical protein
MKSFHYDQFNFDYDPFPIGVAPQFIAPDHYQRLVDHFPEMNSFGTFFDNMSNKKALSELYNTDLYHDYIRNTPVYNDFYRYIKSADFIQDVLTCFERNYIDLGLSNSPLRSTKAALHGSVPAFLARVQNKLSWKKGLSARFEFSALPSDGGSVRPHTDAPDKLITLVISILNPGEWDPAWKGGTDVLKPKDIRKNYNFYNKYLDFEDCDVIRTIEYVPNQCILFLKTFNSLHSVPPIQNQGGTTLRRTLTINITQQ